MGAVDGHSTGDFDKDKMISLQIINAFVISAGIDIWAAWEHFTLMIFELKFLTKNNTYLGLWLFMCS